MAFLAVLAGLGCCPAKDPAGQVNGGAALGPPVVEFFSEDAFLRGFRVSPPMIAQEIPLTQFTRLEALGPAGREPFWTLAQWHCVKSLAEDDRKIFTDREAFWESAFESLRVLVDDAGRPELHMGINSLAMYNQDPVSYRGMEVIRPHYLLYHNFFPDRGARQCFNNAALDLDSAFPPLDTFTDLVLRVGVRLAGAEDLKGQYRADRIENWRSLNNRNGFYLWFRVVWRTARARDAADNSGKMFWLGFQVYDSHLPYPAPICYRTDQVLSDGSIFAYCLSPLSVYGESYGATLDAFAAGRETGIKIDVLEAVRKALAAIQTQKNAFMDARSDLSEFTLSHFNIGWELKSPFRGSMVIRDLSLQGRHKNQTTGQR